MKLKNVPPKGIIDAFLCSETGQRPFGLCDVHLDNTSVRAFREPSSRSKRAYLTFTPHWLNMTVADAVRLRKALNRVLRGVR